MKEYHLFYAPCLPSETELPADEAAHAVRVLRMQEGDTLLATDGRGTFFDCQITLASQKHCRLSVLRSYSAERIWQGSISLAVAPTKNMDRMEWLTEKATEIGFDRLTPLLTHNSERRVVKPERLERIAVSATKQSHKALKPVIDPLTPFDAVLRRAAADIPPEGRFIAHCHRQDLPLLSHLAQREGSAIVLIGPEGDFTAEEVAQAEAAGFHSVSLGQSRLRTETAALCAVHILNMTKARRV